MPANLITCNECREPFVITDNGVTCGCPGPIRGNVSEVIGMPERQAKKQFPDNFQESPADGFADEMLKRIRRESRGRR